MRNFIFLILLSAFVLSAHARPHAQGTGRTQTSQPQECKRLCAQDDQYPNAIMDAGETLRQNTCVCTADGVIFYPSNRGILFGEPIGISLDGWMSQDRIVGNTNNLAVPPFEGPGSSDIFMDNDEDAPSYAASAPTPSGEALLFTH